MYELYTPLNFYNYNYNFGILYYMIVWYIINTLVVQLYVYRKQLITQIGNFVHLNMCLALTFGLVTFIVGSEGATSSQVSCESSV